MLWSRLLLGLSLILALAGCELPQAPLAPPPQATAGTGIPDPQTAARNFAQVVDRVEPVARQFCLRMRRDANCDYQIFVDPDPRQQPNAGQTVDAQGRPAIVFTIALVAEAQSQDELALILGHEAAHHINGHLDRARDDALRGAVLLGTVAALGGAGEQGVAEAQRLGAALGARQFSKEHELEADELGARIAFAAGYDPVAGLAFFSRNPDPGNRFLGSHPPNAQRIALVQRVTAEMRAGSQAGM